MKKLLIPSLSLGLLAKTILVSHALAFTLYVDDATTHPNTADTTYDVGAGGTGATAGGFTNFFTPDNPDNGFSKSLSTPTVVKFGTTQTLGPPTGGASGTFAGGAASTVTFAFDLQNGQHSGPGDTDPIAAQDAFDSFVVTGTLTGKVSNGPSGPTAGNSTTKITFSSIFDQTANTTSTLSTNPNNGFAALLIKATIGGQVYNIYLNQVQDIPKPTVPGQTPELTTISGYITTSNAVPEPGAMALLLGSGITGAALLRRRKK